MNQLAFLPGSTETPLETMAEAQNALRNAPYEKGQSSIETEYGWLDAIKAVRIEDGWRLSGIYTARAAA